MCLSILYLFHFIYSSIKQRAGRAQITSLYAWRYGCQTQTSRGIGEGAQGQPAALEKGTSPLLLCVLLRLLRVRLSDLRLLLHAWGRPERRGRQLEPTEDARREIDAGES